MSEEHKGPFEVDYTSYRRCREREAELKEINNDLLGALEMLVDEFGRLPRSLGYEYSHMKDALRAIKKAKGEI